MKTHNQVNEHGETWYEKPILNFDHIEDTAIFDDEVKPRKHIADKEYRSMSALDRFECFGDF